MEVYYKIESKRGGREELRMKKQKEKGQGNQGVLVIFLFKLIGSKLKKKKKIIF